MKLLKFIIIYILIIILFLIKIKIFALEKEIISLAESYNKNGEYYNAITEIMRNQFIYPYGKYYPLSVLILSEAYYKGGNYYKTISSLTECYERFRNMPEGEEALYRIGYVRLAMGSPYFAYRTFQEYQYIYKDRRFTEDISRDLCYVFTLMKDLKSAKRAVKDYEENYIEGKYLEEVKKLQILIDDEINRPKKSIWVSVIGSILIPGFGHFYTGNYQTGIFSSISNAICIYLFYDGYRDNDKMRMIIFGLAELSFYNYSLFSSIRNVYEYNSNENFYKSISLSASKEF